MERSERSATDRVGKVTLHWIASDYIGLHCIALHCIALCVVRCALCIVHCIVHCIALHCIALHCIALHCIALHYITLHYITLHYITLHYIERDGPGPRTARRAAPAGRRRAAARCRRPARRSTSRAVATAAASWSPARGASRSGGFRSCHMSCDDAMERRRVPAAQGNGMPCHFVSRRVSQRRLQISKRATECQIMHMDCTRRARVADRVVACRGGDASAPFRFAPANELGVRCRGRGRRDIYIKYNIYLYIIYNMYICTRD